MTARRAFALLAIAGVIDVALAAILGMPWLTLLGGGLVQLIGAIGVAASGRMPVGAALTVLLVGAALVFVFPAWREFHLIGALIWLPLASAIATIDLIRFATRRRQIIAGGAALAGWILVSAITAGRADRSVVTAVLAAAAPVLGGAGLSLFHRLRRAQQDRVRRAALDRQLAEERIRWTERQHLASELHDVVTHRVTMMVLQANAIATATADPDTRLAMESMAQSGRVALTDLQESLGLLRTPTASPLTARTPCRERSDTSAPVPAVADLIEQSRRIRPDLQFAVSGDRQTPPPVVQRTVFRLVQEGLTNLHKHAGRAPARVVVDYRPVGVDVCVQNGPSHRTDNGVGSLAHSGTGSGLTGLRRRVELLGGSFTAGATDGGGFRLTAHVPHLDRRTERTSGHTNDRADER